MASKSRAAIGNVVTTPKGIVQSLKAIDFLWLINSRCLPQHLKMLCKAIAKGFCWRIILGRDALKTKKE
jgi:hypothetical protein